MDAKFLDQVYLRSTEGLDPYLMELPALCGLLAKQSLDFSSACTFFIGENGSGKSTLLEGIALAAGFNAEGGTRNFNFSSRISHSNLWKYLRLSKIRHVKDGFFLRAESFYNVASQIDDLSESGMGRPIIDSYGGTSLHHQSHGESFMTLVEHRFAENGLYILDEPEAALSPSRIFQLMVHIRRLISAGSQFIIATHSPILMAFPGATLYEFGEDGIKQTFYEETEHYRLTKLFLDSPERMLRHLFDDPSIQG